MSKISSQASKNFKDSSTEGTEIHREIRAEFLRFKGMPPSSALLFPLCASVSSVVKVLAVLDRSQRLVQIG